MTTHSITTVPSLGAISQPTVAELQRTIAELRETIARMEQNPQLGMLTAAGLAERLRGLTEGSYTVIFCDIDKMKQLNAATGSHFATNVYLRAGLRVRSGEIAGQLFGDEFIFVLPERSRGQRTGVEAFVGRIRRQLAAQPLRPHERHALADALSCAIDETRITATFAHQSGLRPCQIAGAIEQLSGRTLAAKRGAS